MKGCFDFQFSVFKTSSSDRRDHTQLGREGFVAWLDVHLGQICEQNSSIFQSWHRFFKQFSAKWDLVQDVAYYLILLLFWPGCLH